MKSGIEGHCQKVALKSEFWGFVILAKGSLVPGLKQQVFWQDHPLEFTFYSKEAFDPSTVENLYQITPFPFSHPSQAAWIQIQWKRVVLIRSMT